MKKSGKEKASNRHMFAPPQDTVFRTPYLWVPALVTAVATLALYIPMLPPTVTGEDSGELIAAAYTLGIPHPPGYPLWCMLGKLFTLLPIGCVAWRVALMSTVFAAGAVAIVSLIVMRLTRNVLAATVAGLAVAVSADFWAQSLIAEVYTLNALILSGCVYILLVWNETRQIRLLYLFAFVYGLGLCNHQTMHLLGPAFAVFILAVQFQSYREAGTAGAMLGWKSLRTYLYMLVIAFGVWFIIHLYLPIRSLANPSMDWGNPETWDNFWYLVLRKQYDLGFIKNALSIHRFVNQVAVFLEMHARQWTVYLSFLPLLGLFPLWKQNRRVAAFIMGLYFYIVVGFILILNYDLDTESRWINSTFFISAHMLAAIALGAAIAWLAKPKLLPIAIALSAAIVVVPALFHFKNNDKSDYYFAYDYGVNLLKTLDQNAIYFPSGDHSVFPVIYLQDVEHVRPDVLIGNRFAYEEPILYKHMPDEVRKVFSSPPDDQDGLVIQDWTVANSGRPVYFGRQRSFERAPDYKMTPAGLLFKAVPRNASPIETDYWSQYQWHTLNVDEARGDFTALNILHDYHYARARVLFGENNKEEGFSELELAAALAGDCKEKINNIAGTYVEQGKYDAARDYYQRTLDLDPNYREGLRNLAILLAMLNEIPAALPHLQHVIDIDTAFYGPKHPKVAEGLNDLGILLLLMKQTDQAIAALEKARAIDQAVYGEMSPISARDMHNLSLALRVAGRPEPATRLHQQALHILESVLGPDHRQTQLAQQNQPIQSR